MKNRRSALEARKRQKQKEEQLHMDYVRLNDENEELHEQNRHFQGLLHKYLRPGGGTSAILSPAITSTYHRCITFT